MTRRINRFPELVRRPRGIPVLFETIPPQVGSDDGKVQAWQDQLVSGLASLPIDAINIPEVRDEARNGKRTYRYSRKMEPRVCGKRLLAAFSKKIDIIINRVVVYDEVNKQRDWLMEGHRDWGVRNLVLVGGESPTITYPGPSVTEAATLITQELNPSLPEEERFICGGIVIPTRRKEDSGLDEYSRMLYKQKHGIDFFSTQVLYEAESISRLLREYEEACEREGLQPKRLFLSFAPIREERHITFIKWLGVQVPATFQEKLLQDPDKMGKCSIDLCCQIFETVLDHIEKEKIGVPLGLNVGPLVNSNFSLSLELVQRLAALTRK